MKHKQFVIDQEVRVFLSLLGDTNAEMLTIDQIM